MAMAAYFSNDSLIGNILGVKPKLKTTELMVLLAVCRRMNPNGFSCYQGRADLIAHAGISSSRTIDKALNILNKEGYLIISKRKGKTNFYQLGHAFAKKLDEFQIERKKKWMNY